MDRIERPILQLPENVIRDAKGYRRHVEKFLQGDTSAIAFRAYRVPMGIYEQRTAGKYMVRIRVGAGLIRPYQLDRIARLSTKYGNGTVHITTRQDIQIHNVNIEDTPDIVESLLKVGMSTRGGGGNTVRNITACPRAGVCTEENFNVAPYAIALAEYLLQFQSSYNLPRKFKIAFSGCPKDCAFASVSDLGFFAHLKNGVEGFSVYAAGGLGSNPQVAAKIEDFVDTGEIYKVAEAVKQLFDREGDRTNKHKARLRYVLRRVGQEEFTRQYRAQLQEVERLGLQGEIPSIREIITKPPSVEKTTSELGSVSKAPFYVYPEKTPGFFTIEFRLLHGDISADALAKIAELAERFGQGLVRASQLQNLLISSVPAAQMDEVITSINTAELNLVDNNRPKIITCTGAATCKLGLCLSRNLADAIYSEFHNRNIRVEEKNFHIRISGCPNSCGNHHIATLGFEGKAKRINGRLMPFYDVLVGAKLIEARAHLATKIGSVPAKRVPNLCAEIISSRLGDVTQIKRLVERFEDISEVVSDYFYDFGQTEVFSLAGRGPGECGAGVIDVIKVDLEQAKTSFIGAQMSTHISQKEKNIYQAILSAARALLVIFGIEPQKDREIFQAFEEHLIVPGWVSPQTKQIIEAAIDWKLGNKVSLVSLSADVEVMINRIDELFSSLDADLKFRVKPFNQKQKTDQDNEVNSNNLIDLRGVECPLNFVKAKLALEKIPIGAELTILLDDGEPIHNVPASFIEQGQQIIETERLDGYFCVTVRRVK